MLQARLALSGTRYLRMDAAASLAVALHDLVDGRGTRPELNWGALPPRHALGLCLAGLLQRGLGVGAAVAAAASIAAAATTSSSGAGEEDRGAGALCVTWDEYAATAADSSLCGDWEFSYWRGDARHVPAPHAKFGTAALCELFTPALVLSSLEDGVWGRALVAAAADAGLVLESWGSRPAPLVEGAAAVGSASAWSYLSRDGPGAALSAMKRSALALASAAVAVLQQPPPPPPPLQ